MTDKQGSSEGDESLPEPGTVIETKIDDDVSLYTGQAAGVEISVYAAQELHPVMHCKPAPNGRLWVLTARDGTILQDLYLADDHV